MAKSSFQHLFVESSSSFASKAKALRAHFESRFREPRDTLPDRFIWDYWHVEDQYTMIRTQARHFFGEELFAPLQDHLLDFAENRLGCGAISDPWLSYYIEGCEQHLHTDSPHGPWAYVYSLSPSVLTFQGGDTLVSKPGLIDFWSHIQSDRGHERNDFFDVIRPKFNQLTVFDPRFPHGVSRVRGTMDPMKARLVIHGWFVEPTPQIFGDLAESKGAWKVVEATLDHVMDSLSEIEGLHGTMTVELTVSAAGAVTGIKPLTNTVLPTANPSDLSAGDTILDAIKPNLKKVVFPKVKSTKPSRVVLPILFR
jgi:hypothetical protein